MKTTLLYDLLRFWFRRTSDNAMFVLITLAWHLNDHDLKEGADYLLALSEYRRRQ